ncbi:hypothetical protein BD311DRAFT_760573 [Dichomitus squalens]|uniref:Uncharacterized protein n=1 Tax=Dichomitus squalens TaxID=114155 RepID=A0A4Q9MIT3_9APHY|nr:hypothetical protein BD311DRAFT_760573 [Dichomitus squalens]
MMGACVCVVVVVVEGVGEREVPVGRKTGEGRDVWWYIWDGQLNENVGVGSRTQTWGARISEKADGSVGSEAVETDCMYAPVIALANDEQRVADWACGCLCGGGRVSFYPGFGNLGCIGRGTCAWLVAVARVAEGQRTRRRPRRSQRG